MKKQQKIRDIRNKGKATQKAAYQQKTAEENAVRKKQATEATAKALLNRLMKESAAQDSGLNPVRERKLSTEKKSSAKAAGLKSTFVLGNSELLMTAFGKGNDAIIEKRITSGKVETVAEKPTLTVTPQTDILFRVDGRVTGGTTDNPLHTSSEARENVQLRHDLIHAKAALEQRYYGQEFEDNIHIQAIYNILDIEKILAIHVNNIVYTLNNFLRNEGEDLVDLVGYITLYKSHAELMKSKDKNAAQIREWFIKLCHARQLGYLNLEVNQAAPIGKKSNKKKADPNTIKLEEPEFFDVLYALGTMRQMLAHGSPNQNIYKVDGYKGHASVAALLDHLYAERVSELNSGFLAKATTNLALLFRAFGVNDLEQKKEYVRAYYDFPSASNTRTRASRSSFCGSI